MTVEASTPTGRHGTADLFRIATMFRNSSTLSRADVVRRSGLSRSTASQRLDALIAAGLVVAADVELSTGGRPANLFALNRNRGVLLLADIGATAMRNAVCNLRGERYSPRSTTTINIADGPGPRTYPGHPRLLRFARPQRTWRGKRLGHRLGRARPSRLCGRPSSQPTDHDRLGPLRYSRLGSPPNTPPRSW